LGGVTIMVEAGLGTGEISGKIHPGIKRRFAIFQIGANAIEARFDDGLRPIRAEVKRMVREEVRAALRHALAVPVTLDCPRLYM
jgi:hypothetical protein